MNWRERVDVDKQKVSFFNLNLWVRNEMIATISMVAERVWWCEMLTILRINKLSNQSRMENGFVCVCLCERERENEFFYDPGIIIIAMNIHINSLVAACTIWTIHSHLINKKLTKKIVYKNKAPVWYSSGSVATVKPSWFEPNDLALYFLSLSLSLIVS